MKKRIATLLALGLLTLASCRIVHLHEPGRIAVQASSTEAMRNAIVSALTARRWLAAEEQPGVIQATLLVRTHVAKIRIEYDADSFTIQYVGSTNLDYMELADGTKYIHPNYNKWVHTLAREISERVSLSG